MNKKYKWLAVVSLSTLLLASCGGKDKEDEIEEDITLEQEEISTNKEYEENEENNTDEEKNNNNLDIEQHSEYVLLSNPVISKVDYLNEMEKLGHSRNVAEDYVDTLKVDWSDNAYNFILDFTEHNEGIDFYEVESRLNMLGFTEQEMDKAITKYQKERGN